ncbi:uncharacterized protein DS421_13g404410 [Arachis hypogaea]|nr:uncharacterized protein DS421_13g404410 [Arachis hypogaea]
MCFLELQVAELKGKRSYVTVNFYRTKVMPMCREGEYEQFYRIKFFIGITDRKKSNAESWRFHGFSFFSLTTYSLFSFKFNSVMYEEKGK